MITKQDNLWVHILKNKYCKDGELNLVCKQGIRSSIIWCAMCKCWLAMRNGMKWHIGNGNLVRFWLDWWIGDVGPLMDQVLSGILNKWLPHKVAEFMDLNGNWMWDRFAL